jgi:hypothetical protein
MGPIGCPRGNKVVLLKWAPVSGASDGNGNGKESAAAASRRRYVPVRPLELEILVFLRLFGCLFALWSVRSASEVGYFAVLGLPPVINLGTM